MGDCRRDGTPRYHCGGMAESTESDCVPNTAKLNTSPQGLMKLVNT